MEELKTSLNTGQYINWALIGFALIINVMSFLNVNREVEYNIGKLENLRKSFEEIIKNSRRKEKR